MLTWINQKPVTQKNKKKKEKLMNTQKKTQTENKSIWRKPWRVPDLVTVWKIWIIQVGLWIWCRYFKLRTWMRHGFNISYNTCQNIASIVDALYRMKITVYHVSVSLLEKSWSVERFLPAHKPNLLCGFYSGSSLCQDCVGQRCRVLRLKNQLTEDYREVTNLVKRALR